MPGISPLIRRFLNQRSLKDEAIGAWSWPFFLLNYLFISDSQLHQRLKLTDQLHILIALPSETSRD